MKTQTPSAAMLVFKQTDKKKIKPLFKPSNKRAVWKYQNDLSCKILYGCSMNQLPMRLRKIVERVLNDRHRQREKGEQALMDVGSALTDKKYANH